MNTKNKVKPSWDVVTEEDLRVGLGCWVDGRWVTACKDRDGGDFYELKSSKRGTPDKRERFATKEALLQRLDAMAPFEKWRVTGGGIHTPCGGAILTRWIDGPPGYYLQCSRCGEVM